MTTYGVIGKSFPKADAREKATGKAAYSADVQLSGLLRGKILRSPHPHAWIRRIDTSKAEQLKGVAAVVTAKDATPTRFGQFLADRTVFATDRVRFAGDSVAAVAAVDEATAEEALGLIDVEYEELPAVFDTAAAMSPEAPILHPDLAEYKDVAPSRRYGNVRNDVQVKKGDAAAAFAACDLVLEGRFRAHPSHPGYLEPRACAASWDSSGKVTIWSATKAPFRVRTNVADGLGVPLSKVRIIVPALGGDFGGKGGATIEPIAAVLARKAGRPVRLVMTREEEMAFQATRHPCTIELKVGATRDGLLRAVQGQAIFDVGAYSMGGNGKATACVNLLGPYRVADADLAGLAVYTNNVPAGQVRAPAGPQTFFAMETMMDDLARRLDVDPWEIRRRNALQEGDRSPTGRHVLRNVAMRAAIDAAAAATGPLSLAPSPNAGRGDGEAGGEADAGRGRTRWGVGVASGCWHLEAELGTASSASIKLNEDGSAVLFSGVTENGGGQYALMAQIVAEVLGMAPEDVSVMGADTDATPYESGTGGSNTTYRVGNTVKQAAEDARAKLLDLAAERLEANVEDLEIRDKQVSVKGSPDRAQGIGALAAAALTSRGGPIIGVNAPERQRWLEALGEVHGTIDAPALVSAAAEVKVDPETGSVRVLRYVAAQDVGFALNPQNVTAQIEGSVSNGLGYALTEESIRRDGRILNSSFLDYKMPTALDTPPILPVMVEGRSTFGPYGAKGVGEPSISSVPSAIINAVYDAVGVRIRETPVTPEKVLKALRDLGASTLT